MSGGRKKYICGFTVHDAKEISQDGTAVDPLVVVRCLGKEYKTALKTGKIQHCKFEESYVWSDFFITEAEFGMTSIEFELQAANVFFRNTTIGVGKVQLAMVRQRPNRTYSRKQLQLSNEHQLTAKLTVTVFCYGEGDKPPSPDEEHEDKEEKEAVLGDLTNAVIGDTGNQNQFSQFYHLFVQVYRAENLGGNQQTFNPYISVEFNGHEIRNPAAKNTNSLSFDDAFRIPVVTPLFADSVVIRIWDSRDYARDEVIVQGRLSFSLLRMHALAPKWFNFYGFNDTEVNDVEALLSSGEELEENFYLGRLLIGARVNKVPTLSALQLPALTRGGVPEEPPSRVLHFLMDVWEISGCAGAEVYVEMSIGMSSKKTKAVSRSKDSGDDPSKIGRFYFVGDKGRMSPLTQVIPTAANEQLDILLSLYSRQSATDSWARVGFVRRKVADVKDWSGDTPTPQWYTCASMAHLPLTTDPGSILCSLAKHEETVLERGVPNVKPCKFELRCYLYQARDLRVEGSRLPNTYVEMSCAGEKDRSPVVPQTQNPKWQELLTLPISLQCSLSNLRCHSEPIDLIVYDVVGKGLLERAADFADSAQDYVAQLGGEEVKKEQVKDNVDEYLNDTSNLDLANIGSEYAQYLKDQVTSNVLGDVLAAKRIGNVKGGKKIVGRQKVAFRKLLREVNHKTNDRPTKRRWLKLEGGLMGTGWAGDILVAFEMMRAKFVPLFPPNLLKPVPKPATISVSLIGLRNLKVDPDAEEDEDMEEPILELVVPSVVMPKAKAKAKGKAKAKAKAGAKPGEETAEAKAKAKSEPKAKADPKAKGKAKAKAKGKGKVSIADEQKEKAAAALAAASLGLKVAEGADVIEEVTKRVEYEKKPEKYALHDRDVNKRWESNGKLGFEFLKVVHLEAALPKKVEFEPDLRIRLFDKEEPETKLAEGRMTLADVLPWEKPKVAKRAVTAKETYSDSSGDESDGMPVSDADEENSQYITVELGNQPSRVMFNKDDKNSFPPMVTALAPNGAVEKAGIEVGDWLIGVRKRDENEQNTATWSPAQAMELITSIDKDRIRPLWLSFRKKVRTEAFVRVIGKEDFLQMDDNVREYPPKIKADVSKDHMWRKAGITGGWRIYDINGISTTKMNSADPKFLQLLKKVRPAIITCRPYGTSLTGASDRSIQEKKAVLLSGRATKIEKEYEHMLRHKDGALAFTRVPRPSALLPNGNDSQQLNIRAARAGTLDVQGLARFYAGSGESGGRPSVGGCLEEYMPPSLFRNMHLYRGAKQVATVKLRVKVVSPPDKKWVDKQGLPDDKVFFSERNLRIRFKFDQPHSLRLRLYVTRGLNVSGAETGYGNPYLYYVAGSAKVSLEGHRKMESVEPRYFRTEEKDIKLPEQSSFEIGLMDWRENGEDLLIGKSTLDLEDRYYTNQFAIYMRDNKVPVEYRPMNSESGDHKNIIVKGSLEMWIELLDTTVAAEIPVSKLTQPPSMEVEIRLVCWTIHDLNMRMSVDEYGDQREAISIRCRCQIDCKAYLGPQPRDQETDQHDSCVGDGEFNWRFVYSRIQVTKGVPLDCFLQLSVWEYFTLARPIMLCETLLDLKYYVKQVADDRTAIEMEADIPLSNKQLHAELKKELLGEGGVGNSEANDDDDAFSNASDGSGDQQVLDLQEQARGRAEDAEKTIPPAAYMKLVFQVMAQTEASNENNRVGLARNEPNRHPPLPFPSTGRDWKYTLPTAATAVEAVVEGLARGPGILASIGTGILVIVIVWIVFSFPLDPETQCVTTVSASCLSQQICPNCWCCGGQLQGLLQDESDTAKSKKSRLCRFKGLLSKDNANDVCAKGKLAEYCNLNAANGATCTSPALAKCEYSPTGLGDNSPCLAGVIPQRIVTQR